MTIDIPVDKLLRFSGVIGCITLLITIQIVVRAIPESYFTHYRTNYGLVASLRRTEARLIKLNRADTKLMAWLAKDNGEESKDLRAKLKNGIAERRDMLEELRDLKLGEGFWINTMLMLSKSKTEHAAESIWQIQTAIDFTGNPVAICERLRAVGQIKPFRDCRTLVGPATQT